MRRGPSYLRYAWAGRDARDGDVGGAQLIDSKNPSADAWIAAAALQLNVPLVTHNAGDYRAGDKLTILTAAGS